MHVWTTGEKYGSTNASVVFLRLQLLDSDSGEGRFFDKREVPEECDGVIDDLELPAKLRASDGVCAKSLSSSKSS